MPGTNRMTEKGPSTHKNPYAKSSTPSTASAAAPSLDLNLQVIPTTFSQAFPLTGDQELDDSGGSELPEKLNAIAAVSAQTADRDHHALMQPHVLYVSTKQRGNGVLKYIRNVPFEFSKMVPDYIMSTTSCALFLSIKYHQLYPNYIHRRLGELKTDFRLRVLLVLVDVEDNANALLFLNRLAVTNNMTLILSWTEQEAARYLETYKALDGKDASSIQKREGHSFLEQNADFMTACKPINKTDATNLIDHFSTITAIAAASQDELGLCEGLGPIKVQKLYDAFHKPFSKKHSLARKSAREKEHVAFGATAAASTENLDGTKDVEVATEVGPRAQAK